MKTRYSLIGLLATVVLIAAIAFLWFSEHPDQTLHFGDDPAHPTLRLFTTAGATTPQLPLWAAVQHGTVSQLFNLDVELWNSTDQLQNLLLAGKGDLWFGHVDGFALAARRGAPVRLLAVTGWRKFAIVSRTTDFPGIAAYRGPLAYTPPGIPAVPVLKGLLGAEADGIEFSPFEPQALAQKLASGQIDTALAPEPLVTQLLQKVPGLKVVAQLEDFYGRRQGTPPRMPIAGLAVNTETARRYPSEIAALVDLLEREGTALEANSHGAERLLPAIFERTIPRQIAALSLLRDKIHVEPAPAARDEIIRYLKLAAPGALGPQGELPPGFLGP